MISKKELCSLLGVSGEFLRLQGLKNPNFPSKHKVGKNVRYKLVDVNNYIESCKVEEELIQLDMIPKRAIKKAHNKDTSIIL
ncbi:MAG: hypothetical protein GY793_08470 [Proteobacteria bacterium]|nr:hypothetical protein [Pseudomonadota bacterium]